jgi:NADP-dependent 3-hydroxy acid dehydrogenase YdfG
MAHQLELSGLIIAPDLIYPTGAIQDLSPTIWSDTLSLKVLSTINVTHTFLPLLSQHRSRILILTPNIMHALQPPQNSIESVSISALETFTKTLRREAKPLNVHVSHIKLGSVDFGTLPGQSTRSNIGDQIHDYRAVQKLKSAKGSSPRDLHHAVFHALTMSKPFSTRHVGRGSLSYEIIGRIVPNSLVDWMLSSYPDRKLDLSRSIEGWENVDRSREEE